MIILKKLKVGVIGTGMAFERLHYPAYQQLADRYEIVALSDVDPEKALRWADILHLDKGKAYADYHEMMQGNELDVVDIIVPIELNYAVTEDVARIISGRGAGIICEKPLAPNLEQARAARDLPGKFNVPIMIAENYRYSQEMDLIRDLVRTGRIGKIFYFVQNRVDNYPEKIPQDKFQAREWRQHPEFPGGAILDTALHDIAGLRHIFGPIHQLQAFGRPQDDDFSPYSVININLLFKNGTTGQFTFFPSGQELQRPLIGLRIFGTLGMIYLEERDAGTINLAYTDGGAEQIPYQPQKGYYNELLNFYNALTGSEPISVTPEMEYGDFKTVMDILKSIEENRIVFVDQESTYQPIYH